VGAIQLVGATALIRGGRSAAQTKDQLNHTNESLFFRRDLREGPESQLKAAYFFIHAMNFQSAGRPEQRARAAVLTTSR